MGLPDPRMPEQRQGRRKPMPQVPGGPIAMWMVCRECDHAVDETDAPTEMPCVMPDCDGTMIEPPLTEDDGGEPTGATSIEDFT